MFRFIVRRVLSAIPVFIIGSLLMFLAIRAVRDPSHALVSNHISPDAVVKFRQDFGLDKPWWEQYLLFLGHFFRGNMGNSLTSQGAVWPVLRSALVNTVVLGLFAAVLYITVGIVVGVISAVKQYSWFDHLTTGLSFVGLSIPPFFFGFLLIVAVGTWYQHIFHRTGLLLPYTGLNDPGYLGHFNLEMRVRHLILPALTLCVQEIAIYSRYMRTSMLEGLNADYLRTARAKGVSERRVIFRHAFRNALIPLTTLTAIDIGALAGGLIITETVFTYPGMGLYFITALKNADYPQLLPWSMIVILFVVAFNLLADVSYAWLDPRIRLD